MQNNAFTPHGQTISVDNSNWVQVVSTDGGYSTSYRIRNTTATAAYIAWSPSTPSGAPPQTGAPVGPTPTAQSGANIYMLGMVGASVEVFCLPPNAWFRASASTFEVTAGEGI